MKLFMFIPDFNTVLDYKSGMYTVIQAKNIKEAILLFKKKYPQYEKSTLVPELKMLGRLIVLEKKLTDESGFVFNLPENISSIIDRRTRKINKLFSDGETDKALAIYDKLEDSLVKFNIFNKNYKQIKNNKERKEEK